MTIKLYGARLTALTSGEALTADLITTRGVQQPIHGDQWARNGKHPNAQLMNRVDEAYNQAVLFRTKEYFSWYGTITPLFPVGTTDENRWRFAFRSGPYAHAVLAVVGMLPPSNGIINYATSVTARLDIFNSGGSVVASDTFVYGPNPKFTGIGLPDAWPHFKPFVKVIDGIAPNTDYTALFTTQGGRLQSACVAELASLTEAGGYLAQNLTGQSAVLDVYRKNPLLVNNKLWQGGGGKVFNWVADDGTTSGPVTINTTPFKNLVDQSTAAPSSSTAGFTLDMTGKAREGQPGVPVVMKVYGGSTGGGIVRLVDSTNTPIMQITSGWLGAAGWLTATGVLPASVGKYDLQFSNNGSGTLSVHAVTVYEAP